MAMWFWVFLIGSFGGYLLEKGYAAVTKADKRNRKSFLLLPLCPVYGCAVSLGLFLFERGAPVGLLLILPSIIEYVFHFFYETVYGVEYWSYRGTWGSLRGRVCLPFSLCWAALMPFVLSGGRLLLPLLADISPRISYAVYLLFAADYICSRLFLLYCHDTERLHVSDFVFALRQSF